MTDPTTAPEPSAPAAIPPRGLNVPGLIALILGILTFVFAVIPPTAVIAWIFAIGGIVMAIIGLTRKGRGKATSIAALILSVVGWIVAIVVTVVFAATSVVNAENSTTVTRGSGSSNHAKPGNVAGIGDTVTNSDGVTFTVNSVKCGLNSARDDFYGTDKPTGQFCQVKFTVKNGSTSSLTLDSTSLTGYIGKSAYDSDEDTDKLGSLKDVLSSLNPGLSTACTFYVDVPKGQKLTSVKLGPGLSFGTGIGQVTVRVG
jgi:hypothetical protein